MIEKQTIAISEYFYSIQGEGPSSGLPAVFCRLKGCNLRCGGPTTLTTKKIESPATWRCDTMEVWTKGTKFLIHDLISQWEKEGLLDRLREGARLIITGGEPLLQQSAIVHLLSTLRKVLNKSIPIEIETNGTITPSIDLQKINCWYNCSPKLHSSGTKKEDRLIPEAIQFFSKNPKSIFKWVVSSDADIEEIMGLTCRHGYTYSCGIKRQGSKDLVYFI